MKALSAFYNLFMPQLPGMSPALADLELRQAMRDYCEATACWRPELDPTDLIAGEATYDLDPPENGADLVRIETLTMDGIAMWSRRWPDTEHDQRDPKPPRFRPQEPPFTINDDLTELTLIDLIVPTADSTGGLVLTAAWKPDLATTQLPDVLYNQHSEAVRAAMFSRCMGMPGKPWTNLELASYYMGELARLQNLAATAAETRNTGVGALRTRKSFI